MKKTVKTTTTNDKKTHHDHLIDLFLNNILKTDGLFVKTTDVYPVLLGGVDVMRCSKGRGETQDIDIKFVVIPQVGGPDDTVFKEAVKMRDEFLAKLMQVANASGLLGPTTSLSLSEHPIMKTSRICMYEENHATGVKEVLIDTGIFSNYSWNMFDNFANFFDTNVPVPVYYKAKVPYATCSWTLVDTVRMLHVCRKQVEDIQAQKQPQNEKQAKNEKFWMDKFVKYQLKFALMYNSYNKSKKSQVDEAYKLATQYLTSGADVDTAKLVTDLLSDNTNESYLESHFVQDTKISKCYKLILDFFLETVLGKYMQKYANTEYYPVVLGGADVNRCIESTFRIETKDVDIQFVVPVDSSKQAAVLARDELIDKILSDAQMKEFKSRLEIDHGVEIHIGRFAEWDPEVNAKQLKMNLVVIMVEFKEKEHLIKRYNMVDMNVVTQDVFSGIGWEPKDTNTSTSTSKDHVPIPYIVTRGVLYATCDYTYQNTIDMLLFYKKASWLSSTSKDVAKYCRYVLKLVALTIARKNTQTHTKELKQLYREAYHIIKGSVLRDVQNDKRIDALNKRMEKLVPSLQMQMQMQSK